MAKVPKIDEGLGNGNCQPREVYPGEEGGISPKRLGGTGQASRKIIPDQVARQIKEEGRDFVGGNPSDIREYQCENDTGNDGLNHEPDRPEKGLLEGRDDVAPDHEGDHVPVSPQLAQGKVQQRLSRRDYSTPLLIRCVSGVMVLSSGAERVPGRHRPGRFGISPFEHISSGMPRPSGRGSCGCPPPDRIPPGLWGCETRSPRFASAVRLQTP